MTGRPQRRIVLIGPGSAPAALAGGCDRSDFAPSRADSGAETHPAGNNPATEAVRPLMPTTQSFQARILRAALFAHPSASGQLFGGAPPEPVTVSVVASDATAAAGDQLVLAIVLEHAPHWHSWPSATQDVLPPDIASFAIRTDASLTAIPAWVASVGPIQWPTPALAKVADPTGEHESIEVPTYQGRAIAYLPLLIKPDAAVGAGALVMHVEYQACDETSCLAPQDVERSVPIEITTLAAATGGAAEDQALFAGFESSVFAKMAEGTEPYGAAGLHFIHDVIDPRQTRNHIIGVLRQTQDFSKTKGIGGHRLANWPTKF